MEVLQYISDMEYPYEVYINVNREKQMIDKSSVLIKNNEYETTTEDFIIIVLIQRVKVVVNLVNKNQQIYFWMGEKKKKFMTIRGQKYSILKATDWLL